MGWFMNHQGISVHFVPKESINIRDQTICRGIVPKSIDVNTKNEANPFL